MNGIKIKSWNRKEGYLPYILTFPALIIILVMLIYPIFRGIIISFFDPPGLMPGFGEFVGLENYSRLLQDSNFWISLRTTLIYTICCLVGAVGTGLITALLLNSKFKGRGIARVLMTAPWAIPEVAAVMIWVFMLDPNYGVVNYLMSQAGIIGEYVRWLNQIDTALPTVLFVTIWKIFPFSSIVLLTALQSVPEELYEVAKIDGANLFQTFWNITILSIRPTLMLLSLLVTIWSFKRFSIIWLMTQGGPMRRTESLVVMVYRTAFKFFDTGYAAAIGVLGLVLSLLITTAYFWVQNKMD